MKFIPTRLSTLLFAFPILHAADLPAWALGPFERPTDAQPVIRPISESRFKDPITGTSIAWEKLHTFNPAAVVHNGTIHVLYRAEDDSGDMKIGGHTSRFGLAMSEDGIHFTRRDTPVLFPAEDAQKAHEWPGGCEDPRLATHPDGGYVVTYTQWNHQDFRLGLATSKDLIHWQKQGSPFEGSAYENLRTKSAAIVHELRDGVLVASRIDGKFWMYFGERQINIATSEDLIHWTPVVDDSGELLVLIRPRKGKFDSALTEVGPQAVKTEQGIALIYNAKNATDSHRDPNLTPGVYGCGQVGFDAQDPTRVIGQLDEPFFQPELDWEKTGQYASGTTFAEGLVYHKGRWIIYYGCADSFVGVAMSPIR
ncbi:putative GH43/DUF377 family glycosyl hydrolase [Haloferula luteola]|uniref:Putative GH43/DUF377 family glycosyl hydrolase n=1 Tax=Haloferula luteola TaxID=595692 RepID=A0A840VA70_9BACT|nr:glycoside hydrolase family 130 protein [Haloferula luteola]MBB5351578.1 putative GH43/DUF377 family glycosyl hydrolase [Haloferula luteola]